MAAARENPYPGFNFLVQIDALGADAEAIEGAFTEVAGIGVAITAVEYRDGNEPMGSRKLPGLASYSNIVLKRGITGDLRIWKWVKQTVDGKLQRSTVRIILLDEARQPVLEFQLRNAWPVRFEVPSLNAASNEVAIEVLELCHEGLDLE